MNNKFLTGLMTAVATLTGSVFAIAPENAQAATSTSPKAPETLEKAQPLSVQARDAKRDAENKLKAADDIDYGKKAEIATENANKALSDSEAANKAKADADGALAKANTDADTANKAKADADTALSNAKATQTAMNTAKTNADTALTSAQAIQKTATTAKTTADTALTKAQTDLKTANLAKTKADGDLAKAKNQNDINKANLAIDKANTDITKANTAIASATPIQAAAAKAKTDADNAVTLAIKTQTDANTAKTNAAKAVTTTQTAANTAKTTADNAAKAVITTQTAANTAKTKADDCTAKAKEAQTAANLAKTTAENAAKDPKKVQALKQARIEADKAVAKSNTAQGTVNNVWGNWNDKNSGVQDYKTDKSGFQDIVAEFQQFVQKERLELPGVATKRLDPSKLFLQHDHDVRVWFVNEGAGYRNQLAYEATKKSEYQKGMIFDDVSCYTANGANKACQMGNGASGVLDIGDFVDLGIINGGAQVNFFLRADAANPNTLNGEIYGANSAFNPDKFEHMVAYEYKGYLLMGFEDLWMGGDKDYNDTVFVVDFGKGNLKTSSVPEPSLAIALLGVTGAGMMLRRRRRSEIKA
jgi:hypothetical protein